MRRRTRTITFSLPPEMAATAEEIRRDEGRTMSELLREALRLYIAERQWRQSGGYGYRGGRPGQLAGLGAHTLVQNDARTNESDRFGKFQSSFKSDVNG